MASVNALFSKVAKMYAPGGASTAGVQASLDRARTKFLSSGMSNLINAGLANTTLPAGLAGKFAEEVEAPTLASSESNRIQNLANVLLQQASIQSQEEQAKLDRALQERLTILARQPVKQPGTNVFGEPMPGTLAYSQAQSLSQPAKKIEAGNQEAEQLTALYKKIKNLQAPVYFQPTQNNASVSPTLSSTMIAPTTWSEEELQELNKRMGNVL